MSKIILSKDECIKWRKTPTINPKTNRKIQIGKGVWLTLSKQCKPKPLPKIPTSTKKSSTKVDKTIQNIVDLPLYMWPHILDQLDVKSLYELCTSSKKMKNMCNNSYFNGKYKNKIGAYLQAKDIPKYGTKHIFLLQKFVENNNIEGVKVMLELGKSNSKDVFIDGCYFGNLEVMKLGRDGGYKIYGYGGDGGDNEYLNVGLDNAAGRGHTKAMELLKKWGADDFDGALGPASQYGQLSAMKLLKKWGAKSFGSALIEATGEGQLEAMKLLVKWGNIKRDDLEDALQVALRRNDAASIILIKNWLKNKDYDLEIEGESEDE